MKFVRKSLDSTKDISRGSSKSFFSKETLNFFLLVLISLFVFYSAIDIIAINLPDSLEAKIFGKLCNSTVKDKDLIVESYEYRAQRVFLQIVEKNPNLRNIEYKVIVDNKSDVVNAYAVPGGTIIVTSKLMESIKTDEGLAFVLAHELAHHNLRHCMRNIARVYFTAIVTSVLGSNANHLSGTVAGLSLRKGNQVWEKDADIKAVEYVKNAGLCNENSLEFFYHIQKNRAEPIFSQYFSSHPVTSERIKYLKELVE